MASYHRRGWVRKEERRKPWTPTTKVGKMVAEGKITSVGEILEQGLKIREPEIVRTLLPDVRPEIVSVGIVAGPVLKTLFELAGPKDVYSRTFGSTDTPSSLANAVYDALSKSYSLNVV